jgi:hypothetical protein
VAGGVVAVAGVAVLGDGAYRYADFTLLGNPKSNVYEHSSKFSISTKLRFNRPV